MDVCLNNKNLYRLVVTSESQKMVREIIEEKTRYLDYVNRSSNLAFIWGTLSYRRFSFFELNTGLKEAAIGACLFREPLNHMRVN